MPLLDSFFAKEAPPPPSSSVPLVGSAVASVGTAIGAASKRVKLPNLSIKLPSFDRNLLRNLQVPHWYLVIGAASISSLLLVRSVVGSAGSAIYKPIPSPRETLPPEVLRASPYPPDALEGARDVQTPYGSIRVYEWGPKDGKRILLIHGISTPSVALSDLAHKLVKKGCRVMLFDLFGRGYSSAPSPKLHRYDSTLYNNQILWALQSSPVSWSSFAIIGYSLGGAIAADFASYLPNLVRGLVLVAPGGLIRPKRTSWKTSFMYSTSSILPEFFVDWLVSSSLRSGPEASTMEPGSHTPHKGARFNGVSLSESHGSADDVLKWQVQHHKGFVPAFISSIRFAPIHNQQQRWSVLKENMESRHTHFKEVWFVLGEMDPIVDAEELMEDAKSVLGDEHAKFRLVKNVGHEVAMERADDIVRVVGRIIGKGGW